MIELCEVTKSFGDAELLRGVNLSVNDGDTIALMGSSGSGKTVLLKIITGLIPPDNGEVIIDGRSIVGIPRRILYSIRENIGMIFQGSALFDSMNIEENISFALKSIRGLKPEIIGTKVREAMDQVKLGAIEKLFPAQISGGMKKRVGIARAVVARPKLLIADEPTAGLDPFTSRTIARLLAHILKKFGMTCIIVTTSLEIASIVADKVAFLNNGKIETITTPEEIANNSDETLRQFAGLSNRNNLKKAGDEN